MKGIKQTESEHIAVNEHNRGYIERFITENYKRLSEKFSKFDDISLSAVSSLDKLNETIVSLYTDSGLSFADWDEAERYMSSKFTDKAIRVVVKKPIRSEEEEGEEIN